MARIIISDEFGQHGLDIQTSIINGYGSDISDQIEIVPYWNAAFNAAKNDANVIALIRSTTGVAGYINNAKEIYPRVQTFFPLGSNIFTQLTLFIDTEPPVIVTSGAGDDEDRNNTGYGNGLEFWDQDLDYGGTGIDASSFSNGYILGKLLKIKDTLGCSWWEARYRARITTPKDESNRQTSPWDLYNGYGKIDTDAAIAFVGVIPQDPYLIDLSPVDTIITQDGNQISIKIDSVAKAQAYKLFNNNLLVLTSPANEFTYILENYDTYSFTTSVILQGGEETNQFGPIIIVYTDPIVLDLSQIEDLAFILNHQVEILKNNIMQLSDDYLTKTKWKTDDEARELRIHDAASSINNMDKRISILENT